MSVSRLTVLAMLVFIGSAHAEGGANFDAAKAFGARQSVTGLSLSPDGQKVAYVAPASGQGGVGYILSVAPGTKPKPFLVSNGNPERLGHCFWISNERLACRVNFLVKDPQLGVQPFSCLIAVNADGSNLQVLSARQSAYSYGVALGSDGYIIDRLPGQDNAVLMTRIYRPDDHIGSRFGSEKHGLAVDLVDTRNLDVKHIEPPRAEAAEYITDSRGNVRIFATARREGNQSTGVFTYLYRTPNSTDWHKLADFNSVDRTGFATEAGRRPGPERCLWLQEKGRSFRALHDEPRRVRAGGPHLCAAGCGRR